MINHTVGNTHWNYFVALERDLETLSRYVELCPQNFQTYSIELAHLLFAAASEVDVVAKMLCKHFKPRARCKNIDDYQVILMGKLPSLSSTAVQVPRYGLKFTPWENWGLHPKPQNPNWWRSYNNVKHERNSHFNEATLANALNALGALLILNCLHHWIVVTGSLPHPLDQEHGHQGIQPQPALLRFEMDVFTFTMVP